MNRAAPPGTRLGVGDRCPFCGATTGVTESDDGYLCIVCGSPRVIVEGVQNRGGGEKHLLLESKGLKLKRAAWGIAGGVTAVMGVFAGLVTAVLALFIRLGPVALAFALAGILVPLTFSFFAFRRSRRAALAADEALELAQVAVALRASDGSATAEELARKLHVPLSRAEELLALAQVERFLAEPSDLEAGQKIRVESPLEPTELDEADSDENAVRGRHRPG